MNRRRLLKQGTLVAVSAVSAGCILNNSDGSDGDTCETTLDEAQNETEASEASGRAALDIELLNQTDSSKEVSIRAVDTGACEERIRTDINLGGHATAEINNELRARTDYRINVQVADYASETIDWNDARRTLVVILNESQNIVFAEKIG